MKFIVAAGLLMVTSCNNANNSNDVATQAPVAGNSEQMVIRYIDGDTLLAKYNLAMEINEAMLRRSNQLDSEQQKRGAEITRFGNEIQSKYQNNGYLTQESFNADQAKMQQYNIQLNDSIESFIKYYAKQNGYDMILYKASSVYVDPKYDVTNDVVEGLNKRYTKVEKK